MSGLDRNPGLGDREPAPADAVPPALRGLALLPMGILFIGLAAKLFGGGLLGGAASGAIGGAFAGACLAVARRARWPRASRPCWRLRPSHTL